MSQSIWIRRNTNQCLELARYAKKFMRSGNPSDQVLHRTKLFHTDSVICGLSALALKTPAPTILTQEALQTKKKKLVGNKQPNFALPFGQENVYDYLKAITANCSAVREWDSNGTVFGYRKEYKNFQAGEFGHNDFYPVIIASSFFNSKLTGDKILRAMVLQDEIRCRLCEVFALKEYKIDHVVHGAIASIVTFGTLINANENQIESAIGMFVSHYIPFRAIRAGTQLSDSKGASAALSTEVALLSLKRSMMGFQGPQDVFNNPEAIFRLFTGEEQSPFDLKLGYKGDDFAIMGNHFKLGLYEHQSAGAIQAILNLILNEDFVQEGQHENIDKIQVTIYEPAYHIICKEEKKNPKSRQSADHSLYYIVASVLRKAIQTQGLKNGVQNTDDLWKKLILLPSDYSKDALVDELTKSLMNKIELVHGGPEFDNSYPDGIPTQINVEMQNGQNYSSGKIMYPAGHARNQEADLEGILRNLALDRSDLQQKLEQMNNLENLTNYEIRELYSCDITYADKSIDE